jgi:hypothetical protein
MDERAWFASTDAYAMLDALFPDQGFGSVEPQPRKTRLYVVACARRAWDRLPGVCRAVVGLAERVYGTRATDKDLRNAVYLHAENLTHCVGEAEDVNAVARELVALGLAAPADVFATADIDPAAWTAFAHLAFFPFSATLPYFRRIPPEFHSPRLVREVFGNPFRRDPPIPQRCRTDTVMNLACHVEAAGDFAALPVLADALDDAGCDRQDVLDHLRSGGPHARGCWALAWVLADPPW